MNTDTDLLLVLLAVRTLGSKGVPATAEVFKGLKTPLKQAKDQGFVIENTAQVPTTNKAGKVTKKKTIVLDLTEPGEQYLGRSASPETLAAAKAAQTGAVRQALEADREALRSEVLAAVTAKGKGKAAIAPDKEIAAISKTLKDLGARVERLEAGLKQGGDDAIWARIDQAFQNLLNKLDRPASSSPAASPPAAPIVSLEQVLREGYRKLRQFFEFEDGLVEIPRLYHEARRSLPGLSVAEYHRQLQTLWDRRELELKVLNEVREATEPDKAIRRGDDLLYYVYWQNP